jgi:hypothetical protein
MDGNSKPNFRRYCYDIPQDTQLFGWCLSHHHWHNGPYRVLQQLIMTLVVVPKERRRESDEF